VQNDHYGFDSKEDLMSMLFDYLNDDGFKVEMGIPIHKNIYGQSYRNFGLVIPKAILGDGDFYKRTVTRFTIGLIKENVTDTIINFETGEASFCRKNAIHVRSYCVSEHSVEKDCVYIYFRAVYSDESLPVTYGQLPCGKYGELKNAENNQ